jgi:hypothetical protein
MRLQGETASPAEEASAGVDVPAVQTDVSPELQVVAGEPSAPEAEAADVKAAEPQPVSILKSGVVDGMAYTLYSDGSIEAELPSGTIRFESIQALRLHLEKTG